MTLRVGRYGPYIEQGEIRVSVPDDMAPDELNEVSAKELIARPSNDRELGVHPETGRAIALRVGRFGPYVSELLPEGTEGKPVTASLFKTMDPATIDLETASKLMALPRLVGADPADGVEIMARNGPYGPYIFKAKETRSLASEDEIFTVTVEQALELLSQPKKRRGPQQLPPLREIGVDPATSKPIVLKKGRYGPYVTDGETNASLRTGDDPESIDLLRAAELLADRRARGPVQKRGKRAKKAAAPKGGARTKKAPTLTRRTKKATHAKLAG
jgi:DNA topoisomerase-1